MKKFLLLFAILFLLLSCKKEHVTPKRRTFDASKSFGHELYILTIDQSKSFEPRKIAVNEVETLIKTLEAKGKSFDLSIYFIRSPNDSRMKQYRFKPPKLKEGNDLESRRLNANAKHKFNAGLASKRTGFLNEYSEVNDLPRSQYTDLIAMRDFLQTKVKEPSYRKSRIQIFSYTDGKQSVPNSIKRSIPPIEFDRGNIAIYTVGMP